MFQYYFATSKLRRSLNHMFSAFQYDVYVWYGMPEHWYAITTATIDRDVFYCILA